MATTRWLGRAAATKHVQTVTIANTWATADICTLTINGKDLVLTVGATSTTAQVAADLQDMWEVAALNSDESRSAHNVGDSQYPEFAEITATVSGSVVTLTHDTPGVPFTLTASETTGGDGTATAATATTATGPNHWDNINNWSGGAVPANTNDVYIDNSDVDIKYGFAQSAVTLASLNIAASFTGDLGLPKTNADGDYPEYRADYLAVSATACTIGRGEGTGSGRIKIDFGSNQTAVEVIDTGFGSETELEALLIKGTHASNTLEIQSGSVGVAPHGADAATFATISNSNGTIRCYGTVTLTTVNVSGGQVVLNTALTTLTQRGGIATIRGSGAVTTLDVEVGTCFYDSSGTVTTVNIGGPGPATVDCSGDISARTWTTTNLLSGGVIVDPHHSITYTNKVALGADVSRVSAT